MTEEDRPPFERESFQLPVSGNLWQPKLIITSKKTVQTFN